MARRRVDDYENDYDYDDRPPRKKSGSDGGNTAVKIIAILGAVFLGIVVVCGGVIGYFVYVANRARQEVMQQLNQQMDKMREEQARQQAEAAKTDRGQASQFAGSFLKQIRDNDLDGAYRETTADYQKRVPRKDFELFVLKSPGLKWFAPNFEPAPGEPTAGNRFVFRFTAPAEGKIWHPFLTVVKDGANWKVDDINAGG